MLAGLFLSINWLTYIYAVNTGHVLEGSLAYFITPLLNVAAGTLVFKEKQSVFTLVAFLMCVLAVGIMAVMQHQVPYLSLVMALTFSTYGLIKKMIQIDPILSVNVESFYMLPVALLAAVYLRTTSDYVTTSADWSYFVLGGVVTALPIWWFSTAVQKIPLIQMGFMQFVSPTIQFLLAILLYQESFPNPKKWAFLIIWTAIAVYILGLYYQQRKLKLQRVSPEAAPSL
jgi:chloramphenicol-sensitive protein RarD